jgi:hypothetical protein
MQKTTESFSSFFICVRHFCPPLSLSRPLSTVIPPPLVISTVGRDLPQVLEISPYGRDDGGWVLMKCVGNLFLSQVKFSWRNPSNRIIATALDKLRLRLVFSMGIRIGSHLLRTSLDNPFVSGPNNSISSVS